MGVRRTRALNLTSSGYRQRRRALERARRRRKWLRRLVAVVVLAALMVGGFALLQREEDVTLPENTTTTPTAEPSTSGGDDAAAALSVQKGGGSFLLVLSTERDPAFLLVVPGNTLLKGEEGFSPVGELIADDSQAAAEDLSVLLGLSVDSLAEASWQEFGAVLASSEGEGDLMSFPQAGEDSMTVLSEELRGWLAAGGGEDGGLLANVEMRGDAAGVREALAAVQADADLVVEVLPGKVVEGSSYTYFEPDEKQVRELLGTQAGEDTVRVEVQNGSGEVGLAEAVGKLLEPEGYELLPARNADGFPDVTATRIFAASNVLAEADHIRVLLGAGQVVAEEGLPPGRVVVIVGKDLSRQQLGGSGQ